MKLLQKEGISGKKVPFLLLAAVGVIEFLFITLESRFSGISYYLAENYVIVPCLLLLGYVLQEKPNDFAKRRLRLAVAAVSCGPVHSYTVRHGKSSHGYGVSGVSDGIPLCCADRGP